MSNVLRVGLLGAGRIGKVHAAAIASQVPEAMIVRVVDVVAESAETLGAQYNIPHSTDPDDIFNDETIDAVLICSSTDTHSDFITAAANAGQHIFCEKPIDHNLRRIDAALAAAEKAGVKLLIGFNRRFDANFAAVQQSIVNGDIGEPHILRITSRDPAPPPVEYVKISGGIFLDMMIHDFDMARFLMNSEVTEVYAVGGVLIDPAIGEAGDVDTAVVTLKFANGAIGTIDNSRQAVYGYDQRVEVFGSKGMVNVKNNLANTRATYTADGVTSEKPLHFFLERYMEAYGNEMKAFVDCVVNDKPSPVSGADGRAPILIGMAAQRSLDEGRPVRISEITG